MQVSPMLPACLRMETQNGLRTFHVRKRYPVRASKLKWPSRQVVAIPQDFV